MQKKMFLIRKKSFIMKNFFTENFFFTEKNIYLISEISFYTENV